MKKLNITNEEALDLEVNIEAAKGFLELLYGVFSSTGSDELTGNILYLITDAEDRLKKSLEILGPEVRT